MDTTTPDPDRRIEDAKQSLMARIDELGKRMRDARGRVDDLRHKLEVPAQKIAAHPLAAVGIAFAAGAFLGLLRAPRTPRVIRVQVPMHTSDDGGDSAGEHAKRGLTSAIGAALGALAIRVAKDQAFKRLSIYARDWYLARQERMANEQGETSEVRTSQQPEVESFLRH